MPDLANIALIISNLLRKQLNYSWTPSCEAAFVTLRNRLEQEQRLLLPNLSKDFDIFIDSSQYALGMAPSQKTDRNNLGVAAYSSKKLTDAQREYSKSKRELLVIVLCLEKYEKYFAVSESQIYVYTDHETLQPLLTARHIPDCLIVG